MGAAGAYPTGQGTLTHHAFLGHDIPMETLEMKSPQQNRFASLAFLLCALPVGCGGAAGSAAHTAASTESSAGDGDTSGASDSKAAIEAAMKRELEPLKKHSFEAPSGTWKGKVEAVTAPTLAHEDGRVTLVADLGIDSPLHCTVHDDDIDAGHTFAAILEAIDEDGDIQSVQPYDLQSLQGEPAMFVRAYYVVVEGGQKKLGEFKVMVAPGEERSAVCMLDVVGYTESFKRVTLGLVESYGARKAQKKGDRLELWKVTIGKLTVGYEQYRAEPVGKKGWKVIETSTTLLPTAPNRVRANDDIRVMLLDREGRLTQGTYASAIDGQLELQIELERAGAGYHYEGRFKGKPIDGSIDRKELFSQPIALPPVARRVAKTGKADSLELAEYHPGIDPTQATIVSYELEPTANGSEARSQLGSLRMRLTADKDGSLRRWATSIAGAELSAERIYEHGSL